MVSLNGKKSTIDIVTGKINICRLKVIVISFVIFDFHYESSGLKTRR